ncbi:MAG: hypothetical protein WCS40_03660, partial [Methanomethylophilus sp.]
MSVRRDAVIAAAVVAAYTVPIYCGLVRFVSEDSDTAVFPQAGPNDTVQSNPITRRNDTRSGEKAK